MNRTRRKAAKMFRRKNGKATFNFWKAQDYTCSPPTARDIETALTEAYANCKAIFDKGSVYDQR